MQADDLSKYLKKLPEEVKAHLQLSDEIQLSGLSIQTKNYNFEQHEQLLADVQAFETTQAWLCFQQQPIAVKTEAGQLKLYDKRLNEVQFYDDHASLFKQFNLEHYGYLLYGELAKGDAALHIRQDGQAGWIVTTYAPTDNDSYLLESITQMAEFDEIGQPNYRVYWQFDPKTQRYCQAHAHFCGFL
ncbi:hypothetical protein QUF61_03270 [Candidatus Venteria ishoeyi]|uniref:hypothetical protein n=1 Tax=Candidatus Venteria ishoeyi TaxID=1899563 RepID=UPI0025A5BE2F|nr:hypothetical protein [Candidatus Venteria ishoeyi]MDM8545494.1 hypothetical protein [Candidatus Venteria ishoeyi]